MKIFTLPLILYKKAGLKVSSYAKSRPMTTKYGISAGICFLVLVSNTAALYAADMNRKVETNFELRGASWINSESFIQENITVRGTVSDVNGNGLSGVSISLKGTNTGTTTDADGNYLINVPKDGILIFTYIGFVSQEIGVNGRQTINLMLEEGSKDLEEVVVTALGIERQTRSLTYSTQSVNTEQMTKAREPNIMNSLQGKVAGLSINSSASGVGASTRVILRGNKSISGDSQPLYVVDGVPIRGNPDNLNSDNIESINILKGPNAAALYGSAAQNGAIVIETKRGTAGVTNVGVSQTFMIQQPMILTKFQNEYGQGQGGIYDRTSEYSWGPRMEGQLVEHWSLEPALAGSTYALTPQPNNNIDIYQNGYNSATNVYATIGGERTQTMFTYTLTNAEGTLPGNKLKRHNVSARMNNRLAEGLMLDVKADYTSQMINNSYLGGRYNPTRMIYRLPRSIQDNHLRDFEYTDSDGYVMQNYFTPGSAIGANPYWILNRVPNEAALDRIIALTSLSYQFSDAFRLMVRGSYDGTYGGTEERVYNDNYGGFRDGQYNVGKSSSSEFNSDFLASFNKGFASEWNIDVSVGGNIKIQRNSSVELSTGQAMIVPNFFAITNTNLPVVTHNPGLNQDIHSLYAFGQLSWRNAVFLDVTGRNDWSSTLPSNNRSYFYPSVGLSAVLSDLIAFPEVISLARLRGSWAEVGNSARPYMVQRTASFAAGGSNGFLQLSPTLPNANLRPERTRSTELGLDLRFFQNRLGLDITAYKTNTYDQLFTVALPVGSGASEYYTNGGDVENKGIEALVSSTPVRNGNFSWDLNVNFGLNRNMVNRISDERPRVNLTPSGFFSNFIIEEGQPFGNIYSRGFVRDDQGRIIVGSNGLPQVTSGITELVANFNPDWTGGVSNSFRYRNFGLSFLIEHRQGGTVASETNAILYDDGVTEQTLVGRNGDLVFGQNVFANEVAVLEDGTPNNIAISAESFWRSIGGRSIPVGEAFVDDATNTRLRELTLDYTLPQSLFNKWPVSNVQLSVVGRNLFFIYRKSENLDPDFMGGTGPTSEGTQAFTPASSRSFGFSLKVDF